MAYNWEKTAAETKDRISELKANLRMKERMNWIFGKNQGKKTNTPTYIFAKHMKYQDEEKIDTDLKSTSSWPDDNGAMSIGCEERKLWDPRLLYLARLSSMYEGHNKPKTFSSVQGFNHVSFLRGTLENVFQPTMKWIKNKNVRGESHGMNTLVMSTETSEHRGFQFGSKSEGKDQNNFKMFEREHQTMYRYV